MIRRTLSSQVSKAQTLGHLLPRPLRRDSCSSTNSYSDTRTIMYPPGRPTTRSRSTANESSASREVACTTAYAMCQFGAAKLLMRTKTDLDLPMELVIKSMVMSGMRLLTTYSQPSYHSSSTCLILVGTAEAQPTMYRRVGWRQTMKTQRRRKQSVKLEQYGPKQNTL